MTGWHDSIFGLCAGIGVVALGLLAGLGFYTNLASKGEAEVIRAQAYTDTLRALTLNYDPESSEELKECFQALEELEKGKSDKEN